jgi:hypothetical protein
MGTIACRASPNTAAAAIAHDFHRSVLSSHDDEFIPGTGAMYEDVEALLRHRPPGEEHGLDPTLTEAAHQ